MKSTQTTRRDISELFKALSVLVRSGDSLEGYISYHPSEAADVAPDTMDVLGVIRTGNLEGQGGMTLLGLEEKTPPEFIVMPTKTYLLGAYNSNEHHDGDTCFVLQVTPETAYTIREYVDNCRRFMLRHYDGGAFVGTAFPCAVESFENLPEELADQLTEGYSSPPVELPNDFQIPDQSGQPRLCLFQLVVTLDTIKVRCWEKDTQYYREAAIPEAILQPPA